jgi:hypothetical protein
MQIFIEGLSFLFHSLVAKPIDELVHFIRANKLGIGSYLSPYINALQSNLHGACYEFA